MRSNELRLLRFADVPTSPADRLFRYSRARAVALVVAVLAGSAGLIVLGLQRRSWLLGYLAVIGLLALVIMQTFVRARFRPTNWLVRATDAGMFVQFRSYLNYRFAPECLTVAFLPYDKVQSARVVRERRILPDPDRDSPRLGGFTEQRRTLIELELSGNLNPLRRAMDDEIARCLGSPTGVGRGRTRYQHIPVRMSSPATMQLEWKVTPGPDALLDILRARGIPAGRGETTVDFQELAVLSADEQRERLTELARTGNKLAAVALVRRLYGYDLTKAKAFVEELLRSRAN